MDDYKIEISSDSEKIAKNNAAIREGLQQFNNEKIGKAKEYSVIACDAEKNLIGGAIVYAEKKSIFIDILWVKETVRNSGLGAKLLLKAEEEGKKLGVMYSTLDTFEFQAIEFYQKNGYEVIGEFKEYIEGHDRIFFRKKLR